METSFTPIFFVGLSFKWFFSLSAREEAKAVNLGWLLHRREGALYLQQTAASPLSQKLFPLDLY